MENPYACGVLLVVGTQILVERLLVRSYMRIGLQLP